MIYVLGANGQLGQSIKKVQPDDLEVTYLTSSNLDITNESSVKLFFNDINSQDTLINCAAYTAVDKAEDESEKAFLVNATGPKYLSKYCNDSGAKLIHISTDYVFDGESATPYTEDDKASPIGAYGRSKHQGELDIISSGCTYVIIRTAWVFSEFGNNFVKTMLKLSSRDEISVVNDQVGSPTYAPDLALLIFEIINKIEVCENKVFHFSNSGECSWYDFAKEILHDYKVHIKGIPSSQYPTKAKRPHFSLLNTDKIVQTLGIEIPHWKDSLKLCLRAL